MRRFKKSFKREQLLSKMAEDNQKMGLYDENPLKEHQSIRKKLWCDVYVAYVAAPNSTYSDGAYKWADIALQRFDERFK